MVSIRLSDEEFRRLKELCEVRGARSLSDLAREAMHRMLQTGDGPGGSLQDRVAALDERVSSLQRELARLSQSGEISR